jgi:hypothetical protein
VYKSPVLGAGACARLEKIGVIEQLYLAASKVTPVACAAIASVLVPSANYIVEVDPAGMRAATVVGLR